MTIIAIARGSMGKNEGGGTRPQRPEKRGASEKMHKANEKASKRSGAAPAREAERLRDELANERKRVQELENTNHRVAERLDAAIASVKAILDKQG